MLTVAAVTDKPKRGGCTRYLRPGSRFFWHRCLRYETGDGEFWVAFCNRGVCARVFERDVRGCASCCWVGLYGFLFSFFFGMGFAGVYGQ